MSLINQFNGLGGTITSRESLNQIRIQANLEGNTEIASRIANLLLAYPEASQFELENDDYIIEPVPSSFLHGLDYEQAPDEPQGLGKVSPTEVYDMITAKIIAMIEAANARDYKKTWEAKEYGTGYTIPFNFSSKKRYRGVNVLMLTELEPLENPFFLTFKQVKDLKGKVKKGAKGFEVVYFTKIWKTEDKPKNLKFSSYDKTKVESFATENGIQNDLGVIPMLKYYHVYNGKDIEGIDFGLDQFKIGFIENEIPSTEANKFPIPEAIIKNYPKPQPTLKFGGNRAFYSPSKDHVQMPHLADFDTVQDYYRTLLHEFSHSTGSSKRLARDFSGSFGSKKYAFEELVAELGAIFLSAEAGIIWHNNKNHAAYLKSWNSVLAQIKEDNKFIMKASTAAQKVADFVLQFDENGDPLYFDDLKKEVIKTVEKPVIKKASNYGKKTKRDPKPKAEKYPFSKEEIPYEVAYRAYTGISFSPEKRAVSEQSSYYNFMKEVYDENIKKAKASDKLELFEVNFLKFKEGYLKRSLDHLRSKHGIFSSMIAGPAKFPVARMEKKNRIANDKLNELIKFGETGQKRLLQSITPEAEKPIKTGAKGTLEILKEKLTEAESIHKKNLDGNKLLKKLRATSDYKLQDLIDGLINLGFTEEKAKSEANYMFKHSYAGFSTTNSNAKVKRIKDQIALEEKLNARKNQTGNKEFLFKGGHIIDNYELNKIQISFEGKPDEKTRSFLKKSGQAFKWSPNNGVWQRQLNTYYSLNRKDLFEFLEVSVTETINNHLPKDQKKVNENLESNPKGFAIKPRSASVITAIKEVLTLPKFSTEKPLISSIIYKYYSEAQNEDAPRQGEFSTFDLNIIENTATLFYDYDFDYITQFGVEFVNAVNNRLESLRNQKNNYALFEGLKVPVTENTNSIFTDIPEENVLPGETAEVLENEEKVNLPLNRNSLAYRRQNRSNAAHDYYEIGNPDVSEFLGQIEKKKKESVAITIAGGQGSGKTSFVFQLMNAFAKNYKVGHASIEEHPESALYENKAERFWNENAKATIDSPEINSLDDIHNLIMRNDVIVIDSFSKLLSMNNKITLDETFRKKYDGKLFVIIYQLTTDGKMRGGSSSQFDGDIILFVEKFPDFADNYVYADKNRYQNRSLDELHYNIATAKLMIDEAEEELKFTEEIERI